MKLLIKFNKTAYNWNIYLNGYLFLKIYLNKNKILFEKFSKIFNKYSYLLKILRQFGLINSLKNFKSY